MWMHYRRFLASAAAVAVSLATAACDNLNSFVTVDAPSRIAAAAFETPSNAGVLRDGVIGDFECAFVSYVVGGGMTAGELQYVGGTARWQSYDRRQFDGAGLNAAYGESSCSNAIQGTVGVYIPLSTARFQGDNFLRLLQSWSDADVPGRQQFMAIGAAYGGYAYTLLGEAMCQAAFDNGPALDPPAMFALAETRFTTAIAAAQASGNRPDLVNMATLGRARARLDLGRYTEAEADARLIPTNFVFNATYSIAANSRRANQVFGLNIQNTQITIPPAYQNIVTQGVAEPRVTLVDAHRTGSALINIPLWYEQKYTGWDSPIPIASWREAQLIIAEAEARAGNVAPAVAAINALRASVNVPAYPGGTATQVLAQVIEERRVELFLQGSRMGDIRRFNLTQVPTAGTVYPLGGTYGGARCYPLPDTERLNNPTLAP